MKNIAAALVKAQRAFGPTLKSSTNPHFKSKYADLAACVEAVIEGLNANGIYLAQACHESETGVTVETQLIHESGEMYSAGKLHVPAQKQDPQGYGSALTYARRYSLMAACGIAPEDDDGNAGSRPKRLEETEGTDPWSVFKPAESARIRAVGQVCIQAFNEGKEWSAFEEYTSLLDKAKDNDFRNNVILALWDMWKPHSALRAYIKKAEQDMKAREQQTQP